MGGNNNQETKNGNEGRTDDRDRQGGEYQYHTGATLITPLPVDSVKTTTPASIRVI